MPPVRFEKQFPEPLRCWIVFAPKQWPGAQGWWLDLAREELVEGRLGPGQGDAATFGRYDLTGVSDVAYLPPVDGLANWWRQELRQRLTEARADPIVQFFPGEELEAGGGIPVLDLTPALLASRLRLLQEVPAGVHCCWPLIPGLTDADKTCRKGLAALARAGVAGVQPLVPSLSATCRRKLGDLTDRRGYRELFHGAAPDVRAFARLAQAHGLASFLDRPACGRSGRVLGNRRIAAHLHLIGELILRTGGSVDESLTYYRAARWADAETLDVEDLARTGNLGLVPQVAEECAAEIREFVAGAESARLRRLEIEYRGAPGVAGTT